MKNREKEYFIKMLKKDINFFNSVLEGYEGGAVCTTIKTKGVERIVRVLVAPFFEEEFLRLCEHFKSQYALFEMIPRPEWYRDSSGEGKFIKDGYQDKV